MKVSLITDSHEIKDGLWLIFFICICSLSITSMTIVLYIICSKPTEGKKTTTVFKKKVSPSRKVIFLLCEAA